MFTGTVGNCQVDVVCVCVCVCVSVCGSNSKQFRKKLGLQREGYFSNFSGRSFLGNLAVI